MGTEGGDEEESADCGGGRYTTEKAEKLPSYDVISNEASRYAANFGVFDSVVPCTGLDDVL